MHTRRRCRPPETVLIVALLGLELDAEVGHHRGKASTISRIVYRASLFNRC